MTERVERKARIPRIQKIPGSSENARVKERNFDVVPTDIEDVFILVDHDSDPDLKKSTIRKLRHLANPYVARSELINHLTTLQEKPHEDMENLAVNNPGLRGVRDLDTGAEVQINPHTEDVFNELLLEVMLGAETPKYVHKNIAVTVVFDAQDDYNGFIKSAKRRLKRQGFSIDQIDKILKTQSSFRVDKKPLESAIKKGEVKHVPGAWNKRVTDWKIVPRIIPSQDEIAETEEETVSSKPQSQQE